MKKQRSHEESPAGAYFTEMFRGMLAEGRDLAFRDAALKVGAGDDAEGTILCLAGVEMQANGQHIFEYVGGRLDVEDAGFGGPWAEALSFYATPDGDGHILVPRNLPVGICNLVEENAAHGDGFGTEDWLDEVTNRNGIR